MAYICSFSTQEAELEAYGEFEDNFSRGEFEARRGKTAGEVTLQHNQQPGSSGAVWKAGWVVRVTVVASGLSACLIFFLKCLERDSR